MAKYRKKPVVIEATPWLPDRGLPDWAIPTCRQDGLRCYVETLEGTMTAEPGDWLIQGVKGEVYPCKPDIFETTYELVE